MEAILNWKGNMAFEGAGDSGVAQKIDADPAFGGSGHGAPPMEFVALGLAGCTAMDVISILQRKKQEVKNFQVQVRAERAVEHPKVFTRAVIEYSVGGKNVEPAAVLRAIELSAEKYCPVQAMLSKAFPIRLVYKIFDEDGKLINEGEYKRP